MCSSQRSYRFVLGTGEPVSNDAEDSFLSAHRAELHAIDGLVGSGFGLCCNDSKASDPFCVRLTLRLCSAPLPELVEKLRLMQAKDRQVSAT